jgi:hypothetical protein
MRIINAVLTAKKKVLDVLDPGGEVDARVPDEGEVEETEEQQLQRTAEIQQAFEDMRRQERIMAQRI